MSYISSGIAPSPFLAASRHHFHYEPLGSSTHPHYHTNSYTNYSSYLSTFASPHVSQEPKYFRTDLRNVFPQISRLQTQQEQKILNPLNTYSGNVFDTSNTTRPFDRGEIYYGNKNPKLSALSQRSGSTIIDNLEISTYRNKKQNPFHKKYLLSEKNIQLQNYAFYSTIDPNISVSQPVPPKRRKTSKPRKFSNQMSDRMSEEQETTQKLLRMATKYDKIQQQQRPEQRQQKSKSQYNSTGHLKVYQRQTFQPPKLDQYRSQRQHDYLIQSDVDQKQFDSFGQGKQYNREGMKAEKINPGDTIILGLAKMAAVDSNKQDEYHQQEPQSKSRRQPVFIDSEDDERKSGTFKVPEAIIDEINNRRIPSTIYKRSKQFPSNFSIQKSLQITERGERQKGNVKKQDGLITNRTPPSMIMLRGKTYQKLSL